MNKVEIESQSIEFVFENLNTQQHLLYYNKE